AEKIFHDTCSGRLPSDSFIFKSVEGGDPVVFFGICIPIYSKVRQIPKLVLMELALFMQKGFNCQKDVIAMDYCAMRVVGADPEYLKNHDARERTRAKRAFLMDLAERYIQNLRTPLPKIVNDEERFYFRNFFRIAKQKLGYPQADCRNVHKHIEELGKNKALTKAYLEVGLPVDAFLLGYCEKNADTYDVQKHCSDKTGGLFSSSVPKEMEQETDKFVEYLEKSVGITFLEIIKKYDINKVH
ncbi:MAG TPA: hypothetical protein PLA80_13615, partial [Synergistaceae bacterium]|nr:hypothetical protein [Synergistaceae bacterium]